ncbi:hypothetical protein CYY_008525 [Polysphondylium violaceum]|uniref:Rho-GAP domain-containing protein n=1 Tax=Polysphondylium violaceum TaxID=133409 RepID=A0A8J4UX82_9MYCE|nr:hypothetical protein CYY_008525 [Polysphondylium violaceum]
MTTLRINNVFPYLDFLLTSLEKNGVNENKLYDDKGNESKIIQLYARIKTMQSFGDFRRDINDNLYTPHDIAWTVFRILRDLNDSIFSEKLYKLWIVVYYDIQDEVEKIEQFKTYILDLPDLHIAILIKLFSIFRKITIDNATATNLSPEYIGDLFATALMRFHWENEVDRWGNMVHSSLIINSFILHYNEIFSEISLIYKDKEQRAKNNAEAFMNYVNLKYLSLDKHFRGVYERVIPQNESHHFYNGELLKTLKVETNGKMIATRKKSRPPIPLFSGPFI